MWMDEWKKRKEGWLVDGWTDGWMEGRTKECGTEWVTCDCPLHQEASVTQARRVRGWPPTQEQAVHLVAPPDAPPPHFH